MTSDHLSLENPNRPRYSRGVYISKRNLLLIAGVFLLLLIVVGAVVHGLADSQCARDGDGDSDASRGNKTDDGTGGGNGTENKTFIDMRLPRHLEPVSYGVKLLAFIVEKNFTFNGDVKIIMKAVEPATNITVHVNDMTIHESSVSVQDLSSGKEVEIDKLDYDTDRQFFLVHLKEETHAGSQYQLNISYVGNVNDKLAGFYRSSYQNEKGEKVWLGVTQFEPTDARRAFPCFDEPSMKAIFNITLGRKSNMRSVSNMPRKKTMPVENLPGYHWDVYQSTLPMSTYLVAFLVTDFEQALPKSGDENDIKYSILVRKEAENSSRYALEIGPKVLSHYEDFFNVKYPLPKQDMAAIPDFAAGAMENWGLITYRETALLYEPGVSSRSNKQRVAIVVAHELAHQWFGNLVTPAWWTYLWLNEGFATYIEYLGSDYVEPEWKMKEQFVTSSLHVAMSTDSLESSHQLAMHVNTPSEILALFDRITYDKGASIIRMIDHFMTIDSLRKALTNYLNKLKYKAATQEDLWEALTEQGHKDRTLPAHLSVKTIMDTWTLQTGFPVVHVARNYESGAVKLNQTRYLLSGNSKNDSSLWWIPITYTVGNAPNFEDTRTKNFMNETELVLKNLTDSKSWLIVNVQECGFYKVNYDANNWKLISEQLKKDHTVIHSLNRAQLIDDSLDLARSGHLEYTTTLDILDYLKKDEDYIPWTAALDNLGYVSSQLERTSAYGSYMKFITALIEPQYQRLGFDAKPNDTHLNILHRSAILGSACSLGYEDCLNHTKQLFDSYRKNPDESTIPVDIRYTVYCSAIRNGGVDEWDFGWKRYHAAISASEKTRWLYALTCTDRVWLLNRYLSWILPVYSGASNSTDSKPSEPAKVRKQDAPSVFASIASNIVGRDVARNFLESRWSDIIAEFGGGAFQLSGFISTLQSGYNTEHELLRMVDFYREHKDELADALPDMQQAIERTSSNVKWMKRNYATIERWLQKNYP